MDEETTTVSFPLDGEYEPRDPPSSSGQSVRFEIPPSPVPDTGPSDDYMVPTSFTASDPFVTQPQPPVQSATTKQRPQRLKKTPRASKQPPVAANPVSDSYLGFANKKKLRSATGKTQGITFTEPEEFEDADRHYTTASPREASPVPVVDYSNAYPAHEDIAAHNKYSWAREPQQQPDYESDYGEPSPPPLRKPRHGGHGKKPSRSRRKEDDYYYDDNGGYSDEYYDDAEPDDRRSPDERMRDLLVRWKSLIDDGVDVPKKFDHTSDEDTVRKAVELGEAQLDEQTSVEFLQVIVVIIFWTIETGNNRAGNPLLLGDITKNIFLRVDKFNRSLRRIHRMYLSGSGGQSNPIFELGKQVLTTIIMTHLTNMFAAALQDMSSSPIMPILNGLAAGQGDAAGIAQAATMAAGSSRQGVPLMNMIGNVLGNILNAAGPPPPRPGPAPPRQHEEVPVAQNTRNRDNKPAKAPPATYNQEKQQYEISMGDGLPAYTTGPVVS